MQDARVGDDRLRLSQLRQLAAQYFDAGRNRIRIDGVKAHAEKIFRRVGVEKMARAGFNPAEAIPLWQNMSAAAGGNTPPQLLSTHPSNENRIAELQAQQAEAVPLYEQARASGLVPQCKA